MTVVTFLVPGDPQGKGRARSTRSGRHYTPGKTVAYEGLIAHAAAEVMQGRPLIDSACAVEIIALFGVPASWSAKRKAQALAGVIKPARKPDFDNIAKAVGDGINGVVWRDDSLAVDGSVSKRYADKPGLVVTVRTVGGVAD